MSQRPVSPAVTRYLCAGAHLDAGFARAVVDELVADPVRAVAPAPGVDGPPVVRHAVAALRRAVLRDVAITVVLLAVAAVTGLRGLLIVVWLCSTVLVVRAVRNVARLEIRTAVWQIVGFVLLSLASFLGLLTRSDTGPLAGVGDANDVPLQSIPLVILVGFALWIVLYLHRVADYAVLAEQLAPASYARARVPEGDRLGYLARAQDSPLTVYSPRAAAERFVGFGAPVHAWSAGCRLRPLPSPSTPFEALTPQEVYAALRDGFAAMSGDAVVADRVMVPGQLPRGHPFLAGSPPRPVTTLPAGVVADIAARPSGPEIYYLAVETGAPGAGSVVTGLVHCEVRGDLLSVDVALCVLPRVAPAYRAVDAMPPGTVALLLRMLGGAAVDVLRVAPRAPANLLRAAWGALARRVARSAEQAGGEDFGARSGLRELAGQASGPAVDFEATRDINLIGRTVAETVTGLLDDRGLDPADFSRTADQVWHRSPAPAGSGRGVVS